MTERFVEAIFILLFSLVPAYLLGKDFGFSVGVAYFVVAGAVLSVHYDIQAIRKSLPGDRSGNQ